jgi:hypothetical protein
VWSAWPQRGFAPFVAVVGVCLVTRNFFPHAPGVMRILLGIAFLLPEKSS